MSIKFNMVGLKIPNRIVVCAVRSRYNSFFGNGDIGKVSIVVDKSRTDVTYDVNYTHIRSL